MDRRVSYIAIFSALAIIFCINPTRASELSTEPLKEPRITKKAFDNGLTVLIKEVHALPIVSLEARFRVGSASEGRFLGSGISHFVEHMLFKGTPTRKHGDIEKEVKSYGGTINGFTSFDSTGYRLTVESRYFKEALGLLVDAVMNPAFEEAEVEKERNVILKEIKLRNDNPGKRAFQLLLSNVYTTHPYKHPIIGYEDVFKELTRQDLISYHKQHYVPDNLVLGICGDIDGAVALEEIEKHFKDYKRQAREALVLPREPAQLAKREYAERSNVQLSRVLMGYHSIPIWHEDLFALDVLASVLGEGESSVFHRRLVEEEKIAHAVSAFNYTPKGPGVFFISVLLDEENIPEVIDAISDEIAKIKSGKIDKAQLAKVKNSALTGYLLSHESVQAQARDLVEGEILVDNPDFSGIYVKGIESVDSKDVIAVANSYLKENNQTIVSLLPEGAEEKAVPGTKETKDELIINKFDLANGISVLVREDHSLPLVSIRVVMKGGVRVEDAGTNGISNLTAEMLLAGTRKRTKEEIFSSIEELGGGISSFSGNNSFGIGLTLLTKDIDFGLDLISDILQNSTVPKEEFEKTRDLVLAAIKDRDDDIFESGIKLFKENLFKQHPYRFTVIGKKAAIEKLKRKDVTGFYRQYCVPSNLVLAVFGDVDSQKVLSKVEKLFKGFKGEMPSRLQEATPLIKAAPSADTKIMDKEQVLVIGGLKTIKVTDPDRYAFSVLSSILSGSDGRFFYDVRDTLGISYTQGVASVPGLDEGYFVFYIATSKAHKDEARQLIIGEIEKLRKGSVTDEELELAKADLIGAKLRGLQSNSGLAFEASLDELYGLGFDNFKRFDSEIRSVTKEDIDRIIEKYFNTEYLAIVTLGPLQDSD